MRRLVNGFLWLVGLAVVLTVYFLVPLGRYTLFEHTLRIAATEPARELGEELEQAGRRASESALEQWDSREPMRTEANGEPLRLRVDPEGVLRLVLSPSDERVLELSELRERLRRLHADVEDARALLEAAEGAPPGAVRDVERVLREEGVPVVSR